jgi:hypothetical protein
MLVDADTVGTSTDGLAAGWRPQKTARRSESQAPAGSLPTSEQSPAPSKAATPDTRHPTQTPDTTHRMRSLCSAHARVPSLAPRVPQVLVTARTQSGGHWGAGCWVLGCGLRCCPDRWQTDPSVHADTCSGSECGTTLPQSLASARGSRDGAVL